MINLHKNIDLFYQHIYKHTSDGRYHLNEQSPQWMTDVIVRFSNLLKIDTDLTYLLTNYILGKVADELDEDFTGDVNDIMAVYNESDSSPFVSTSELMDWLKSDGVPLFEKHVRESESKDFDFYTTLSAVFYAYADECAFSLFTLIEELAPQWMVISLADHFKVHFKYIQLALSDVPITEDDALDFVANGGLKWADYVMAEARFDYFEDILMAAWDQFAEEVRAKAGQDQ